MTKLGAADTRARTADFSNTMLRKTSSVDRLLLSRLWT